MTGKKLNTAKISKMSIITGYNKFNRKKYQKFQLVFSLAFPKYTVNKLEIHFFIIRIIFMPIRIQIGVDGIRHSHAWPPPS
jgi:hypothetical protein